MLNEQLSYIKCYKTKPSYSKNQINSQTTIIQTNTLFMKIKIQLKQKR